MAETLKMILPITIIEGKNADFEAFFAKMRAQVAAEEPGTLRFDMNRVKDKPQRYVMIEEYADEAAWAFHGQKQAERNVVPAMIQFTAAHPDFMFLEPVGGPLR